MGATTLHTAIERIASLFRAGLRDVANAHGIKLVQLETLTYLSMANRYSDTPIAVAEYLGVTKGTVSQTIKALEDRDLLEKVRDEVDGRLVHCRLTPSAREIVKQAYPAPMLDGLPKDLTDDAALSLRRVLRTLQQANAMRTFGQCRTCQLFEPRARGGRCGLTHETLSVTDSTLLCREHQPAA